MAFRTTGAVSGSGETLSYQAPTGWASGFPKTETDATNHAIECNYSNQFFVLQMYDVTEYDLNFVSSLTLTFNIQNTSNYNLGAWVYPDADWTEADQKKWTEGQCPIVEKFKSVVGVYPGHVNTTDTYLVQAERNTDNTVQTMTFTGAKLKALAQGAVKKGDKIYVSLIITFSETKAGYSTNRKPKMYCMQAEESKQPFMSFEYKPYVEGQPTLEYQYRTNSGNNGWNDKNYPKAASADNKALENGFQQHFAVGMQYAVKDLDKSCTYTLKLDIASGASSTMYAWEYPNAIPTINATETAVALATFIVETTGTAMGQTTAFTGTPLASSACVNSWWTLTINAADLQYATEDAWGYVWLNLILLQDPTSGNKPKIASSFDDNPDHRPIFTTTYANVYNETQDLCYSDLKTAITAAVAEDVIRINNDLSVDARHDIDKAITIYGRTQETKITGTKKDKGVLLAKANITLKNLTVDGNGLERNIQAIECASSTLTLENIICQNATYSSNADVKVNSTVVLKGNNIFTTGLSLNKDKRVQDGGITNTTPIQLILAGDYKENYAIVQTCSDPTLFTAKGADGYYWSLYSTMSGSNHELKGNKAPWQYDLTVSSAKMATLVLGFDATIPAGVTAYQLTNDGSEVIEATPINSIVKNEPVLITAEEGVYRFIDTKTVALDEQPNPTSGCLKGSYSLINVPASTNGTYNYILARDEEGVGFYQVADASCTIAKNRAYLSCSYNSQSVGGSKAPLRIKINGKAPTYLENTNTSDVPQKVMSNGQILIHRSGRLYRLDGQEIK